MSIKKKKKKKKKKKTLFSKLPNKQQTRKRMTKVLVSFYDELFECDLPAQGSESTEAALAAQLRKRRAVAPLLRSGAQIEFVGDSVPGANGDVNANANGDAPLITAVLRWPATAVVNRSLAGFRRDGGERLEWDDETQQRGRAVFTNGSMSIVSKALGVRNFVW